VPARWPGSTAFVASYAVRLVLIPSVTVFSPFLSLSSRGTPSEWGLLAKPRAAFSAQRLRFCPLLVTRHLSLVTALLFLGGTANPEGGRQRTDKAEARRAASAQAAFPSRRAREKAVPEKGTETRRS